MTEDMFPYRVGFSEEARKKFERAAVLLDLKSWDDAIDAGMYLIVDAAEAYAKGKTKIIFSKPELANSIKDNPAFFEALCQEGVIEWLTPFVLTKNVPHSEQAQ